MLKKDLLFLVGPTASGKSAAAVALAKKINAEIICCDSMQVYSGMNILTSAPEKELTGRVRHHLFGFLKPCKNYNAASFRKDALEAAQKIYQKGKIPLFVGGSGLYMSAIIDGLFTGAPADMQLRRKLEKEAKLKGARCLYKKLLKVDPLSASKIHANDCRRIIRSLEVFLKTGKPISYLQKQRQGLGPDYRVKIFALNLSRPRLYQRVDQRVELMFERGLEKEARRLLRSRLSKTACYALGLPEIKEYLRGKYDLQEAKRLIKRNSRHYAKRQLTWFRKDKRVKWINLQGAETPQAVAKKIYKFCN